MQGWHLVAHILLRLVKGSHSAPGLLAVLIAKFSCGILELALLRLLRLEVLFLVVDLQGGSSVLQTARKKLPPRKKSQA